MTELSNRQYFLASRPEGMPSTEHVQCRDVPLGEPAEGQVIIRNLQNHQPFGNVDASVSAASGRCQHD